MVRVITCYNTIDYIKVSMLAHYVTTKYIVALA
jgi:hypothetical protein